MVNISMKINLYRIFLYNLYNIFLTVNVRFLAPLHQHLHQHGVDYLQFSFRWMNNLLTREIPLHCTIRLWDTYLAESDRFASFQLYVCAAFLLRWRRHLLLQPDFQVIHSSVICCDINCPKRMSIAMHSLSLFLALKQFLFLLLSL